MHRTSPDMVYYAMPKEIFDVYLWLKAAVQTNRRPALCHFASFVSLCLTLFPFGKFPLSFLNIRSESLLNVVAALDGKRSGGSFGTRLYSIPV